MANLKNWGPWNKKYTQVHLSLKDNKFASILYIQNVKQIR